MVIKNILREELQNSLQMKENYERELRKLPRGSLIKKRIKGHEYYYVIFRENGKVIFNYKGKNVLQELIDKYKEAKDLRVKYRSLFSKVKKEIKYLRSSLRTMEPV